MQGSDAHHVPRPSKSPAGLRVPMKAWSLLAAGIFLEVLGTTCMKLSNGFARPWPSFLMFACYGLSLTALTMALRDIDMTIAYGVWSAAGSVLIATIGLVWFREPATAARLFWLTVVVCGVIGLRRASSLAE
jgi:small multidrug resistance pump